MSVETTSDYWSRTLAGERVPMTEDEPQPGRYRLRNGSGWLPVAIWREGGETMMIIGDEAVTAAKQPQIWVSCARHPITPEEYDRMSSGAQDADPVYARLPDDAPGLLRRVNALGAIPTAVATQDEASRLADAAHALRQIERICAEREKEESAPLKRRLDKIRAAWGEPATLAKAVREPIMAALTRYLSARNEPGGVRGQLGKAISLRTDKAVEIADYAAALAHFVAVDPEAFRGVVEKLARAAVKAGETPPGVREIEVRRAQ